MRMRLYAAEIVTFNGAISAHIVAPTGKSATQFARDFHDEVGVSVSQVTLTRIDHKLQAEQRLGLDDMLESAPIGFSSHCEPLGWFVHTTLPVRLKLFRIESDDGVVVQIISPNPDTAAAIWLASLDLGVDGLHPLWSISSGVEHLNEPQRKAMLERLEYGPVGIVSWDDERGWLVA